MIPENYSNRKRASLLPLLPLFLSTNGVDAGAGTVVVSRNVSLVLDSSSSSSESSSSFSMLQEFDYGYGVDWSKNKETYKLDLSAIEFSVDAIPSSTTDNDNPNDLILDILIGGNGVFPPIWESDHCCDSLVCCTGQELSLDHPGKLCEPGRLGYTNQSKARLEWHHYAAVRLPLGAARQWAEITTLPDQYSVQGLHMWMVVANCNTMSSTVRVEGPVQFEAPHGYLSHKDYLHHFLVNRFLCGLYTITLLWFSVRLWTHNPQQQQQQQQPLELPTDESQDESDVGPENSPLSSSRRPNGSWIVLLLVLGWMQSILYVSNWNHNSNRQPRHPWVTTIVVLTTAGKETLARCYLLWLAYGWDGASIVPTSGNRCHHLLVGAYGTIYALFLTRHLWAPMPSPATTAMIWDDYKTGRLLSFVANTIFFVWVLLVWCCCHSSLRRHSSLLQQNIGWVIGAALASAVYVFVMGPLTAEPSPHHGPPKLFHTTDHVVFWMLLVLVSCLWLGKPTDDDDAYAPTQQVEDGCFVDHDDDDAIELSAGLSSPINRDEDEEEAFKRRNHNGYSDEPPSQEPETTIS